MNWTARWAIYAILHFTAVLNCAQFWLWADLLSSRFWNFNVIELKIVTSLLLSPSDSGLSSKCRAISACSTLVEVVEVNSSFKDVTRLWSPLKNNGAKFRCLSKLLNLPILGNEKPLFIVPEPSVWSHHQWAGKTCNIITSGDKQNYQRGQFFRCKAFWD